MQDMDRGGPQRCFWRREAGSLSGYRRVRFHQPGRCQAGHVLPGRLGENNCYRKALGHATGRKACGRRPQRLRVDSRGQENHGGIPAVQARIHSSSRRVVPETFQRHLQLCPKRKETPGLNPKSFSECLPSWTSR